MKKDFKSITLSPIYIAAVALTFLFIGLYFVSKFIPIFNQYEHMRMVYPLLLAIPFITVTSKNIIVAIKITKNILTFYVIQNYKIRVINLDIDKITSFNMNIGTNDIGFHTAINLSLDIELINTESNVVLNYSYIGDVPQNMIKKVYLLKGYIPQFSYSLNLSNAPKRKKEIEELFKNNMQEPLYNRILNNIGTFLTIFAILFAFILIYAILFA